MDVIGKQRSISDTGSRASDALSGLRSQSKLLTFYRKIVSPVFPFCLSDWGRAAPGAGGCGWWKSAWRGKPGRRPWPAPRPSSAPAPSCSHSAPRPCCQAPCCWRPRPSLSCWWGTELWQSSSPGPREAWPGAWRERGQPQIAAPPPGTEPSRARNFRMIGAVC